MARDALDELSKVVPRSIASVGGQPKAATGRTPDRASGRRAVDLLAQVPLFSGLSRRQLRRLADHADTASFRQGETIVEAGQPGGTFYVILQGATKVVRGKRTIDRMAPGDFFGEISLLDGGPRTASVVAETPVVAIRVFKRSFDRLLSQEPAVAAEILAVVAGRLRQAERSVTS
ncbi:MAG TPA: cyclic nucleotide-binding domain-containing protein [Actinomycetota bacterium]